MVTNELTTLAILPSQKFYSGMITLLDNIPSGIYIPAKEFAGLFVEDILDPERMGFHPDILRNRIISMDNSSIDYAIEFILENYDCLHERLLGDVKKTLPFLLTHSFTLKDLALLYGSHSLALRIAENENKSISVPFATPSRL